MSHSYILMSHSYEYDNNGNILYVNTQRLKPDMTAQPDTVQRTREEKFRWDEENRLTALSQDGYVSHYWYDADGERTVKMHGGSMAVFVNSVRDGRMLDMQPSTAYFSPCFSIQGNSFTKHLYIGSERIASMTGTLSPGDVSNSSAGGYNISHAGYNVGVTQLNIPYATKLTAMSDSAEANYAYFDLPNAFEGQTRQALEFVLPAEDSDNAGNSVSSNSGDGRGDASYNGNIWFIHADHLGSSTLVTDGNGGVSQQIEYLPYGEVFLEGQAGNYGTPFKFNGKELDEETGLYYYGARYMNPRLSIWYGCDPMQEKYPSISSYAYCAGNPVKFADMFGLEIDENSRNEWNMKVCEIQIELKRLTEDNCKKPSHEVANRIDYLNDLLYGLKYLEEESLTVYELNPTSSAIGLTQYNPENGHIVLSYNNTSNFVHEVVHGIQFELGDIIFGLKNDENGLRNAILIDVFDEIGAYRFQYAYNPSSISDLSQIKINNLSDINKRWLNSIKEDGQYIYNPNYNDRIGIRSIGIENIKDFYKAYPRLREQIPNLKIDLRDYLFKFPHN